MDEGKRARLQALIARAGSSNEEEARTSAWIACKMMREEGITPEQAMAPKALAAAPGWSPPPERPARYEPNWAQEYRPPLLLPSEEMVERARMAEQQAQMREAQALRARQQLARANQRMRQLEEEKARVERVAAERERELRWRRGQTTAAVAPTTRLPTGAGRSEKY
jgi:hypothetical protein